MSQPEEQEEELNEMFFRRAFLLARVASLRLEKIRNEAVPIEYKTRDSGLSLPIYSADIEAEIVRHKNRISLYQTGLYCLGIFDTKKANTLFHRCFLTQFEAS